MHSAHVQGTFRLLQVLVVQHCEITMVRAQYARQVASLETKEGCPITPGTSFTKVFYLVPLASSNRDKHGIALDGYLKVQPRYCISSYTYNRDVFLKMYSTVTRTLFSC
jgi:hypothetical protein